MKIVCDACSAKYSIADDKVKGKVFKIRCKKCSNIIVVRGQGPGAAGGGALTSDDAPPAGFDQKETRVYDYGADGEGGGDEAVWHVVVDQEQVGPVTAAEVGRKFQGGEIDADTFIWREGFADWQPLAQVDVFAALVAGGAGAARGGGEDAVSSMFGGPAADEGGTVRSDPNDLFAAAAAPAASGGDEEDEGGGDIFGAGRAAASSQRRSGEMAAAGGATADKKLRGERNENSVLFSLGNLAALASDAPRSSSATSSAGASGSMSASSSSSSMGAGGSAQHGGGEGSGLIDIRSMASAYLGDQKGAAKSRPSVGSVDDLPVFSSASFSEPVVIMPTQRSGGTNNTLLYGLIAVVGLLAVVAVVLVVVVLGGGKKNDAPAQVAIASGSGSASGAAPGPAAGSDQASGAATASGSAGSAAPAGSGGAVASGATGGSSAEPAGSGASAGSADKAPAPPPPAPDKGHKSHTAKPDVVADKGHDKGHTAATIPDDKGAGKPAPGGKCMDEVGCLLAEHPPACCSQYKGGGGGGGTSKPKPDTGGGGGGGVDSSLPEELDRAAVSDGVGKVRGRINACGDKSNAKGEVKISVKVAANGSVASVSVKNTPDPGLGSCVASAMQGAHFAKTQKGGSFSYPFIFR